MAEQTQQQQQQKREARIINAQEFTDFLNHFLFNSGLYVSTTLIDDAKTETAPSTHGENIILNQGAVNTKDEILGALNTYCNKVELVASKELGLVAKCELLVGVESNLPKPQQEQPTAKKVKDQDESPETEG
jgi:hypothetical protein